MNRLPTRSLLPVLACGSLLSQAQAAISLPLNGGFDISKPGTNGSIEGVLDSGFLKGVGEAGVTVQGGSAVTWDDSTTSGPGDTIDMLGWTAINGAGGDTTDNGPGGSLAWNTFAGWGDNSRVVSDVLGQIGAGQSFSITVTVGGPSDGPRSQGIVFDLLADGVALTPDSQTGVTPGNADFETISRTYDAASLAGLVGQDVSILVGVTDDNTAGNRIIFDDVAITPMPIPEPSSLALLGLGGLFLGRRRR